MVKLTSCVVKALSNRKGYRCGKWNTDYRNGRVIVSHYGTDMLEIDHRELRAKRAIGFESVSDKQGVNKVLRDLNIQENNVEKIKADRGFRF